MDEAIGRLMPALAERQRAQAEDRRHLDIHHDQPSYAGTARIEGELDLADAIDLDAALAHIAGELKDLGNEAPLDQRRAMATGELARRQFTFEFDSDDAESVVPTLVEEATPRPPSSRAAREVVLYAHLSAEAVDALVSTGSTTGGDPTVTLDGHGSQLITAETLRGWLNITGDVRVTIRPVIDLNANLVSAGRFATDLQREQLHLRDRTCIAPHCNRSATHTDVDHIEPWDDDGPPAQTTTDGLGWLCRHHHRAKTFANWAYVQPYPGLFLWTSPHGLRFLTFNGQTIDLD